MLVLVLVLPLCFPVLAGNPGNFSLKTVTEICFVLDKLPIEESGQMLKITHAHIASALPWEEWETGLTSIQWHCKWNVKGLSPIRPAVLLKAALTVPAKSAMPLLPSAILKDEAV